MVDPLLEASFPVPAAEKLFYSVARLLPPLGFVFAPLRILVFDVVAIFLFILFKHVADCFCLEQVQGRCVNVMFGLTCSLRPNFSIYYNRI